MADTTLSSSTQHTMPAAGRWTIDSVHSFVLFSVEHFTVAFAKGIAKGPTGAIIIGDELGTSSVEAVIDAATITTANPNRDEKIHGPDLLDVEKYPMIDFVSTALRPREDNRYELDGNLTIHGVTRPVTLDMTFNGVIVDTWGKTRLGLTATTDLHRDEFDTGGWGYIALSAGGFMVPHLVKVTLDIEATKDE